MKKIYLHTNTEYSFLNSAIRVEKLIKLAVENNLEFLPLTDKENLYALQYYWDMQDKFNIKPLIGIELDLSEGFTVVVLAKNNNGYAFINQLIYAKSEGKEVSYYELDNSDIFIIDHQYLGHRSKGIAVDKYLSNFYLNNKTPLEYQTVYAPAKKVLNFEDNEILRVIQKIGSVNEETQTYNEYLDEEDWEDLHEDVYKNMLYIAQNCNVSKPNNSIKLAKFSDNAAAEFKKLLINDRTKELIYKFGEDVVVNRVNYEISVIAKLGFINYFLIIQDAIAWAKKNKIEVGPGRGSASGSIISYILEITDINPLEFGLLFERFLNIDRVSLPDIDIDIQDNRRNEVLEYIKNKYGEENVALITTFQTLALKNSIRDVARYLDVPLSEVEKICNAIKSTDLSLVDAYKTNPKYRSYVDKYPNLHEYASKIEGLPRQIGTHPAGIIVCDQQINKLIPTIYNNGLIQQVQFTLNHLEKYGLIKIDFLALKNLTILKEIEDLLEPEQTFEKVIGNSYSVQLEDKTKKLLNNTHTNGIFQLESIGMQRTIKEVKIDSFDDIYAIVSLFRPGPMEFIGTYGKNKQNQNRIETIHPLYDQIVKPTFGIIVYQEQIMQIAQQVANMSFAQADLLRRAISKKDEKLLHSYKAEFFKGGLQNNISIDLLEKIYSNIEKFAAYGFNKSHAVAYSLISYKLAFYKANYPLIFYKVLISNSSSDQQNIKKYTVEASEQDIKVQSPEINNSSNMVEIVDNELYLPFNMIKGIGESAVEKILEERNQNGQYENFIIAYLRLRNLGNVTESNIETLIKANAFREFYGMQTLLNGLIICKQLNDLFVASYKKIEGDKKQQLQEFIKMQNIEQIEFELVPSDLNKQIQYESQLLGSIYNLNSNISNKHNTSTLDQLTDQYEWIEVMLTKVTKDAKGRPRLSVTDSTKSVTVFGFNNRAIEILNDTRPRKMLILIKISKGFYNFSDWREVDNG
ncbi:DNA polymerase III subunit alpha [Mycoplasma sp. 21DD0573]|uniref:DNA polymerase III subunit alpha n=1 Tax=unclassified Mycoplasma TaxID=2683645 RepID=UPI002B1D454F|nr:DNA polymerase III subunit alpha [Mycoplasma sp. 21DD0573]MEA4276486.1 DNA polymerase III subunit alpha [Mycoplasma sp. 21DD0573]